MNFISLYLFCIIAVTFHTGCIGYLGHLGKGQWDILSNRREISALIKDDTIDEKSKNRLRLILEAREFAIKELYLNPKGGFEYFTQLNNRTEVGWHVTASYPLKFESYTWWFPIVGKVPYKGFFDLEMAKNLEDELIKKGLDTRLRITAGYSTLGWFSDPVLSPQLRLREDELVALVFHELAHATVYIKEDSVFNESYASFVEEQGTTMFFTKKYFETSDAILNKRKIIQAENKFILSEMKKTGLMLKTMYESDITDEEKSKEKTRIIEEFRVNLINGYDFKFFDKERFRKSKLNNESFVGALRYASGVKFFLNKYEELGKDFSKFHPEMEKLKKLSKEERVILIKE